MNALAQGAEVKEEKAEDGDIFDGSGQHIGNIEAPKAVGDMLDLELGVYFQGKLYMYKLDYRTDAKFD